MTENFDDYIIHNLIVPASNNGGRIDKFISENIEELSRSRVKALCEQGHIFANNNIISDAAFKVKTDQDIEIRIPPAIPAIPEPQNIELDILYEDDDLVVINKSAGMTVHPAVGSPDQTLVNAILHHCQGRLSGIGGVERPGIVHRLDKDTSGILVVAKNDLTHQGLSEQFADHSIDRIYYAIMRGSPRDNSGTVKTYIGRNRHDRKKMAVVGPGGRHSVTHWRIIDRVIHKNRALLSFVECRLETGRTHQIRVHMAHLGHPIIGDPLYGGNDRGLYKFFPKETLEAIKDFPRQALHAGVLGFIHPRTQEKISFEKDLPNDMQELMKIVGIKKPE